jgi:flagellar motor switch protein FliN/FliY
MSVLEVTDTQFAVAAASVLEQALDGAVVFSVGQTQSGGSLSELAPPETGAVFAVRLEGPQPTWLALLLAPGLVAALGAGGDAALAATAGVALGEAANALGANLVDDTVVTMDLEEVAGAEDATLTGAAMLEGTERLATVVLRVGPDAPAPEVGDPDAAAVATHIFEPIDGGAPAAGALGRGLDLIHDVEMLVTVELGHTLLTVRELLSLTAGAVIELDRAAGSPVDVLVNGTPIALGEVVVIDEEFGIRITEIIGGTDGARSAP